MPQDYAGLVGSIMAGEYDDDLDGLDTAIRQRTKLARDTRAAMLALTLKPGQRVRIEDISPAALEGATGTVTVVNAGRGKGNASVELDRETYFQRSIHKVADGIPLSCLTVIE